MAFMSRLSERSSINYCTRISFSFSLAVATLTSGSILDGDFWSIFIPSLSLFLSLCIRSDEPACVFMKLVYCSGNLEFDADNWNESTSDASF